MSFNISKVNVRRYTKKSGVRVPAHSRSYPGFGGDFRMILIILSLAAFVLITAMPLILSFAFIFSREWKISKDRVLFFKALICIILINIFLFHLPANLFVYWAESLFVRYSDLPDGIVSDIHIRYFSSIFDSNDSIYYPGTYETFEVPSTNTMAIVVINGFILIANLIVDYYCPGLSINLTNLIDGKQEPNISKILFLDIAIFMGFMFMYGFIWINVAIAWLKI